MRGCVGDFGQHVVAFDQLTERCVLMIEKSRATVADEKLRAGGIRVLRARHGDDAAHMRVVIELGLDVVTRPASAPHIFLARVFRKRVAALNHEAFDDAVKTGAVIKTFLRKFLEIGDRVRRSVSPELDNHGAFGGVNDGDFRTIGGITH